MNRKMIVVLVAWASIGAIPAATFAQGVQQGRAIASSDVLSQISMFSYREGPKSDLLFRGTPLAATAEGKAQVEYQNGNAQINAEVEKLPEPSSLGPYTNYVLWALTPDGRATNQGVIGGHEGGKGEVDTQTAAPQFALIVTAEPHFAVTAPSTMIVLYNVADDVKGDETKVATLLERSDYSKLGSVGIDDKTPVEIVQARYAVAIAGAAGGERFAPQAFATASEKLAAAERALRGEKSSERKLAPGLAREAVIAGEDARRAAMIASAAAASEAQRVAAASAATAVERERSEAAAANAATAAAQAATASERQRSDAAVAAANAAAAAAAASEAALAAERQRSEGAAAAAAAAARAELLNQLKAALPTRDSVRGLISEIGGVHFATGRAEIDVSGRESLARFSGIVAAYPGLRFNVEGHTDSVGSAAMNNDLSLRRAMAARDYLIGQGVAASSIDVAGLGFSSPISDNATVDGRARNRRVEIVLSGGPLVTNNDTVVLLVPVETPAPVR